MNALSSFDLVGTIAPHSECEQLLSEPDNLVPDNKTTTDSMPDPGDPRSHKAARQAS